MLGIGLLVGLIRTLRASKRFGINSEHILDVVFYGLLGGVITAHVTSIVLGWSYYSEHLSEMFDISTGIRGLSFHGGLAGALGVALIYTRVKKINFLKMVDMCTPALALAYGITRIGCFLNGCCYGIPTNLPWGVRFIDDTGALTPPSHPTQLYATAINLVIFGILVAVERRRRFVGQVFLSYLVLYSVYRFFIEILRKGVTADIAFAGLTEGQVVSILMFVTAAPLLWWLYRKTAPPQIEVQTSISDGDKGKQAKVEGR
jgi:phosphatidylglycerol:prolipoprotein diacylglycerol transferase